MGIVNEIRKTTNNIVDGTQEMVGITKSPKELAKRVIEHFNHKEYQDIARIMIEEAKKYVSKMGLEDVAIVNSKLEELEDKMNQLAVDFEDNNYKQIALKFKELEGLVPESIGSVTEVFKNIKDFLKKISEVLEGYGDKVLKEDGDFSKLQNVFEEYFDKSISKK